MKTIFVNPHTSDFVYRPLSYILARKRALLKYQYLSSLFNNHLFYHYSSSSLPYSIFSKLPAFLQKIISVIEVKIWSSISNQSIKRISENELLRSNIFIFGYKHSTAFLKYLVRHGFNNTLYIHLSHYHTFNIPSWAFNALKISLCFDNDIVEHPFFKTKFPEYRGAISLLPFMVSPRFLSMDLETILGYKKKPSILATGSYHILKKDSVGISYGDSDTLHPIRLGIAKSNVLNPNFINKQSFYSSNNILGVLKGQHKYFSFDIRSAYLSTSHALVAGEGTGAIAIGSLEAMACGCTVFLHESEISNKIKLANCDFVSYSSLSNLISIINDFYFDPQTIKPSIANINYIRCEYSSESLINKANQLFT